MTFPCSSTNKAQIALATMRSLITLIAFIFYCISASGQIIAQKSLNDSSLFRSKVKGAIQQLYKWEDKGGKNYFIISTIETLNSSAKTSIYNEDCNGDCYDKEIYAYHFIGTDSVICKSLDFIKACNYDNIVEARENATTITDINKDGLCEIWFMYSMACTSDVSCRTLKLLLFDQSQKFIVRGTSQASKNQIDKEYGGKYIPDVSFSKLSEQYQLFAKKLWKENLYDMD